MSPIILGLLLLVAGTLAQQPNAGQAPSLTPEQQKAIEQHGIHCRACGWYCVVFSVNDGPGCLKTCGCEKFRNATLQQMKQSHQKIGVLPFDIHPEPDSSCPLGFAEAPKVDARSNPPKKPPNIILFLLDDQDELISPYMDAMPFSKQFFTKQGTHFTNAFSTTSICCAARCQLLSGKYGHNVGVLTNDGPWGGIFAYINPRDQQGNRLKDSQGKCINNEDQSLPLILHDYAGYKTAIIGKYLNNIENDTTGTVTIKHVPKGWTEFRVGAHHRLYAGYNYVLTDWNEDEKLMRYDAYGTEPQDYQTDVIRDKTLNFIDKYRKDVVSDNKAPLFLYVATTAPHFPLMAAPRHYDKTALWAEKFESIVASRPNYYSVHSVLGKSSWLKESAHRREVLKYFGFNQVEFQKRMGSLYAVDEMIEAVVKKIESLGELDNTIFVLTSDNGYNLGAHKLIHKMAAYDESVKIPMWIAGPGFGKQEEVKDFVALIDLAPTFLDAAGLQVPDFMDGFSIRKRSPEDHVANFGQRDAVLLQYNMHTTELADWQDNGVGNEFVNTAGGEMPLGFAEDVPPYTAVRTNSHLFVDYHLIHPVSKSVVHEFELYDCDKDPYQMKNIIGAEPLKPVVASLKTRLEQLFTCKGKSCYNPVGSCDGDTCNH